MGPVTRGITTASACMQAMEGSVFVSKLGEKAAALSIVQELLQDYKVPISRRSNTANDNNEVQHGIALGLIFARGQGVFGMDRLKMQDFATRQLVLAINSLAARCLPQSFYYTTIQLNYNYQSRLHVDASNLGPSFIIGLGAYVGGSLYVYEQGVYDVNRNFVAFDGTVPHMTTPFRGIRYSLIYFTDRCVDRASQEQIAALELAGFRPPPESVLRKMKKNREKESKLQSRLRDAEFFLGSNGGSVNGKLPRKKRTQSTLKLPEAYKFSKKESSPPDK